MVDAVLAFDGAMEACMEIGRRLAGRMLRGTAFRLLMYPAATGVWSGELLIYAHSCPGMCPSRKCVNAFKFDAGRLVKVSAKELKMFFKAAGGGGIYAEIGEFTCSEMLDELEQLGADIDLLKEADIVAEVREELSKMLRAMGTGKVRRLDTCELMAFFQNNIAPFLCFIYSEELSLLISSPEFVAASLLKVSKAFSEKEIIGGLMVQLGEALEGWGKPAFVRMVITEGIDGALGRFSTITIDAILSYEGIGFSVRAVERGSNAILRLVGLDAVELLLKRTSIATRRCSDLNTVLLVSELEPEDLRLILGGTLRIK